MEVYSFFLIVKDMVLLLFPSSEYKLAFLVSYVYANEEFLMLLNIFVVLSLSMDL